MWEHFQRQRKKGNFFKTDKDMTSEMFGFLAALLLDHIHPRHCYITVQLYEPPHLAIGLSEAIGAQTSKS